MLNYSELSVEELRKLLLNGELVHNYMTKDDYEEIIDNELHLAQPSIEVLDLCAERLSIYEEYKSLEDIEIDIDSLIKETYNNSDRNLIIKVTAAAAAAVIIVLTQLIALVCGFDLLGHVIKLINDNNIDSTSDITGITSVIETTASVTPGETTVTATDVTDDTSVNAIEPIFTTTVPIEGSSISTATIPQETMINDISVTTTLPRETTASDPVITAMPTEAPVTVPPVTITPTQTTIVDITTTMQTEITTMITISTTITTTIINTTALIETTMTTLSADTTYETAVTTIITTASPDETSVITT